MVWNRQGGEHVNCVEARQLPVIDELMEHEEHTLLVSKLNPLSWESWGPYHCGSEHLVALRPMIVRCRGKFQFEPGCWCWIFDVIKSSSKIAPPPQTTMPAIPPPNYPLLNPSLSLLWHLYHFRMQQISLSLSWQPLHYSFWCLDLGCWMRIPPSDQSPHQHQSYPLWPFLQWSSWHWSVWPFPRWPQYQPTWPTAPQQDHPPHTRGRPLFTWQAHWEFF